jgi:hypothetical protein
MRTGPGLPPQINREKNSGLPPVTSEKAPALSFAMHRVAENFMSPCRHFYTIETFYAWQKSMTPSESGFENLGCPSIYFCLIIASRFKRRDSGLWVAPRGPVSSDEPGWP